MPGFFESLFNNTQVTGSQQNNNNSAQPASDFTTDLAQSRYDFSYTVFPDTLGMDDVGHYMVININVPTNNEGQGRGYYGDQYKEIYGTILKNELSKVDTLRYRDNIISPGQSLPTNAALERNTRRIAESIALYMPTPLVFNSQNMYQEISLTALAGQGLMSIGEYLGGLLGLTARNQSLDNIIQQSSKPVNSPSGEAVMTASRLMGYPINPAVEILFANTPQRQFVFELLMAPRNEKESISMKKIIKTLRFHAAPELNLGVDVPGVVRNVGGGVFWIPPAEFDITFYNKGKENTNILRVNTCVLERVEVDYAPTGVYSTFRNGHPVAARLSLAFREIEPVHKKRVLQGF
jgi:hypothetical protein